MAWPVDARFQSFTANVTTITKAFVDAVQDAIYRVVGGSRSVVKVWADGTGDQNNANGAGTIIATGRIATTGGNLAVTNPGNYLELPNGFIFNGTVTTVDDTVTTIFTYAIPSNKLAHLVITIIGRKNDTDVAAFYKWSVWKESAGASALVNGGDVHADVNTPAWGGVTISGGGGSLDIDIEVQGAVATTIVWQAQVQVVVGG